MPPRYPHGLKQSPMIMSKGEKAVLAILGFSISAGIYNLVTSPWREVASSQEGRSIDDKKKKPYPFAV